MEHNTSVNKVTKDGGTVLHLASKKGHPKVIQLLIEYNAFLDQADKNGMTALHTALEQGHLDVAIKEWAWFRVSLLMKVRWAPQGDGTFECQILVCSSSGGALTVF
jgi:hypothetical protein